MGTPYLDHVRKLEQIQVSGRDLPVGSLPCTPAKPDADAPIALLFSPHPDDECIIGALPLRLMRESGMTVVNVAVTQGSNPSRRAGRWEELSAACSWLGWDLVATQDGGLEHINPTGRRDTAAWSMACERVGEILLDRQPSVVFFPHAGDWNSTHMGTNLLVMDALKEMPADFICRVVETEFWAPNDNPNLMVEAQAEILADLMAGIACHAKEVERNPYHLSLPAWMQDNVRRGGEMVGGQGAAVPDFSFATLYRLRKWMNGALHEVLQEGLIIPADMDPGPVIMG